MNVLAVDDDAVSLLLITSALAKLGHKVEEALNGREAWQAWEREHHSLVISDWMMPEVDGLEFCRRVRAVQGADLTYIILLTSRAGKANYLDAMEAGVDDFIEKPFDKAQFATRISVASRILRLHDRLSAANTNLERRVQQRTEELANALNAKSELLSRASHELRTPMNHILGFAQLLGRSSLDEKQAQQISQVMTSGRHLLHLIDRILVVSETRPEDLNFFEGGETPRSEN